LKKKPIKLLYTPSQNEKPIKFINFPELSQKELLTSNTSPHERIIRCLRWKPITDAVEERYGIPN